MFSPSGLVPKLPDDLDGISPIAGLGNGGKYTQLDVLLSKNKGSRHQTMRAWGLEPERGSHASGPRPAWAWLVASVGAQYFIHLFMSFHKHWSRGIDVL